MQTTALMPRLPLRAVLAMVLIAQFAGVALVHADADLDARVEQLARRIGPSHNPLYIRADELRNIEAGELYEAEGVAIYQVGGKKIRINPKKKYLWVIVNKNRPGQRFRASKLLVYLAPIKNLPNGAEVGHVNVAGGLPSPIAGELKPPKKNPGPGDPETNGYHRLNNDSGRYGHKRPGGHDRDGNVLPGVTEDALEAAIELFELIGVEDKRGNEIELAHVYEEPLHRDARPHKKREARHMKGYHALGGYVLTPSKDGDVSSLPAKYRSVVARVQWGRRIRDRVGLVSGRDLIRSSQPKKATRVKRVRHKARTKQKDRVKKVRRTMKAKRKVTKGKR